MNKFYIEINEQDMLDLMTYNSKHGLSISEFLHNAIEQIILQEQKIEDAKTTLKKINARIAEIDRLLIPTSDKTSKLFWHEKWTISERTNSTAIQKPT